MNKLFFNPKSLEIKLKNDNFGSFVINKNKEHAPQKTNLCFDLNRYRIEVSLACDLSCKYCVVYMNKVFQRGRLMSLDTAKKIIKQFNRNIGEKGSVVLIGGEPLLNWSVVKYIVSMCKGRIILFTNAYKLDRNKIYFLKRNKVSIITSLDGFTIKHNRNRFYPDIITKYKKVCKNIKFAAKKGCNIAVSCVVNQDNVEDVVDIANFFYKDLGVKNLSFAYPHFAKENIRTNYFSMEMYRKKIEDLLQFSKQNKIYIDQIGSKLKSIIKRSKIIYSCKAGISQKTFYPNGEETICTKLDTIDRYNFDKFLKDLPINNKKCSSCIAVNLCGGGCPWDAAIFPNRAGLDKRICGYNKGLINYIIKDIANELKDVKTKKEALNIITEKYLPIIDPSWKKKI